jgi:hypothetical protein
MGALAHSVYPDHMCLVSEAHPLAEHASSRAGADESHGICARCYATVTRELALMSRGLPLTECAGAGSVWGRAVYGER